MNYVLIGDMNAAWAALDAVLSANQSARLTLASAKRAARALADAATTYRSFIVHQNWPPKLQADVDAELNVWTRFAAAYQHTETLPSGAVLDDANSDIDAANVALLTAEATHSTLKHDLVTFICTDRGIC
jgi:hypothetical protein